MDLCFGNDTDEICTNCDISRFTEEGDTKNLQFEKWDENMSKKQRLEFLIEQGLAEDRAWDLATMDAADVPESRIEQLEVE